MVVGIMNDKRADVMLQALAPVASHFVFTAPASSRALSPAVLVALSRALGLRPDATTVDRPRDAVMHAARLGSPVVVAGSLYLAGEVRQEFS
jgi:folylpolyglutamate synthase/dihydropteroate synthase